MFKFVQGFPGIFGVGIPFPMNEVLVLLRFVVERTVEDSLGYVLTFSFHEYGRSFLLRLIRVTLSVRLEPRHVECVVDIHGWREI
jgi:hypothetical protein